MKDRVREAVFNLVGPDVKGRFVVDLFAGTGAMAWESLSRGASRALVVERRFPVARVLADNARELGLSERTRIITGDAFVWARRLGDVGPEPWLVFLCPPYALFVSRRDDMLGLIGQMLEDAPTGSLLVVEADERFDMRQLPNPDCWDVRHYPPAVVALGEI
jgi:16S rRNA (guanine966-N2)-methyltransferase